MIKIRNAALLALLATVGVFVAVPYVASADESNVASADESKRLVATMLQDEKEQLPQENLAWFSSTKREKRMRIALREQLGDTTELLANLKVSVVNQNLEKREFPVDDSGFVTIDNVEPGAHAVVVTGDDVHAATVVYFKEQPDEADAKIAKPVEMSAMNISNQQLLSLVDNYLGKGASRTVASEAYNDDVQATFNESQPYDFQAQLSEDGTLSGQVQTVMRRGTMESEVGDTNIVLLKDGKPVARALTDQSGKFYFDGVRPGVHGLIAAGRGGYSAFAFEAIGSEGFVKNQRNAEGRQFVMARRQQSSGVLPTLLIPSPMVPTVVEIIEQEYQEENDEEPSAPLADFGGAPMSGGTPTGFGPGGFGPAPGGVGPGAGGPVGGGGGGFGGGGGGGLGGLAALGAVGAAVAAAASSDDSSAPSPISPNVPFSVINQ